jgi:acetamidase/formamidase
MKTIHDYQHHLGWDNALEAAVTIYPGETLEFRTIDASGAQLSPKSTVTDVATLDFAKVNPVNGPVHIEGSEPGDSVKVTLLGFDMAGWGWTANIPGFGLLADKFPEPALHIWKFDPRSLAPAMYGPGGSVPLKPFCGTIGLAPAEPGLHSVVPPRRAGGNLDIRDLGVGTELYLPVEVRGALFSVGDVHAAQGDGEVCGTAIEAPAIIAARFELIKGENLAFPRFTTPGPVTRHLDAEGYEATTGVGPSLMEGARDAVSGMIDLLGKRYGLTAVDAYMLCSVCADLRISEIVDQPNWVVSLYFPRVVFE